MNTNFIKLTKENIDSEHICCAFSDKKCTDSYIKKKEWLKKEFANGYTFRRIDDRAKVFIEYCPAEKAWSPVTAPGFMMINCLWVSGKYKKQGYAKQLLQMAIDDAKEQGMVGLVTIVGTKKFHFMSDTKWLLKQGFQEIERTDYGFSLLAYYFDSPKDTSTGKSANKSADSKTYRTAKGQTDKAIPSPYFNQCVKSGECPDNGGITVYYTNRCPYSEYHVTHSLEETAKNRNLPLKALKLESLEEAQNAPSPATIFSLFYKGKFITTDISVCMNSRFDKTISKHT